MTALRQALISAAGTLLALTVVAAGTYTVAVNTLTASPPSVAIQPAFTTPAPPAPSAPSVAAAGAMTDEEAERIAEAANASAAAQITAEAAAQQQACQGYNGTYITNGIDSVCDVGANPTFATPYTYGGVTWVSCEVDDDNRYCTNDDSAPVADAGRGAKAECAANGGTWRSGDTCIMPGGAAAG